MARRGGRTVGRLIADALAAAGVRWAFTVPGESFLDVLDALPAAGIRVIATRHEGGASFMAEAVGQLTGQPAAVLGTRAVGAANMSIGIHTARSNSTPMVALVGQVARSHLGREAFQESDLVATFGGLAKWATQIDDPDTAAAQLGEGLALMHSGRPGPVLFALPEDVLGEAVPAGVRVSVAPLAAPPPDDAAVEEVLALLAAAKRPVILAGGGVSAAGARAALVALSERLEVPVMAAWRRPTVFPNDHPHYLGMTGYGAPANVRARLDEADALLVIGSRLNEIATFDYRFPRPRQRWAHVDLAPRNTAVAGLRRANICVPADAGAFLLAALERSRTYKSPKARVATLAADRAAYLAASSLPDDPAWAGPGVGPAHVTNVLQRVAPANTIFTTDAGNFGLWLARGFKFGAEHGFVGPTSGAMGYGLPSAIAASLVAPDRPVIALVGDGGLAMTMSELETAVRTGARPVVLAFDNRRYGTIAMHQRNVGLAETATGLGPMDFAAIARAMGAQGARVTRDSEFEPALRDALAANKAALLHLEIDPSWVTPDSHG
ncbi:MAG: thiamine pyrophosphate-binding protein [Chloroflexota bacterium]|nr:thiamine pyrophosphate-binding protein [Chloroflexota bacterium]